MNTQALKDNLTALLIATPVFICRAICPDIIPVYSGSMITLLLLAPVSEELFFRGVLLELALRKKIPPVAANIAVSVLFAAAHLALRGDPVVLLVFLPSLVLGWHYCRNRMVLPVILIHAIYNTVNI